MKAGLVWPLASLGQWTHNLGEKKSTSVITHSFKCLKVHDGQKASPVAFYLLRASIPNDKGMADCIRHSTVKQILQEVAVPCHSALCWAFCQNKVSNRAFPPPHHHWGESLSTEHQSPAGASGRNSTELPSAGGAALPLVWFTAFLDTQLVCSDRKLSL